MRSFYSGSSVFRYSRGPSLATCEGRGGGRRLQPSSSSSCSSSSRHPKRERVVWQAATSFSCSSPPSSWQHSLGSVHSWDGGSRGGVSPHTKPSPFRQSL